MGVTFATTKITMKLLMPTDLKISPQENNKKENLSCHNDGLYADTVCFKIFDKIYYFCVPV